MRMRYGAPALLRQRAALLDCFLQLCRRSKCSGAVSQRIASAAVLYEPAMRPTGPEETERRVGVRDRSPRRREVLALLPSTGVQGYVASRWPKAAPVEEKFEIM